MTIFTKKKTLHTHFQNNFSHLLNNIKNTFFITKTEKQFLKLANDTFNQMLKNDNNSNKVLAKELAGKSLQALKSKNFDINTLLTTKQQKTISHQQNKNKQILFVTSIFPSVLHGGGMRVFDIMYELAQRGYKVSIYCMVFTQDAYTLKMLNDFCENVEIIPPERFNEDSLKLWLETNNYKFSSSYFVWPSASTLIPTSSDRIGKVFFEFIECTTLRLWMDMQQYMLDKNDIPEDIFFNYWNDFLFELLAVTKSDHFICVTKKDEDFIRLLHPDTKDNFQVLSTGISQTEILNKLEKHKKEVIPNSAGFIGNYDHYPNLDGLRWYFKNIHETIVSKVTDYKFYVFGIGNLESLKEEFKHFNNSIEWVGPVDCVVEALLPLEVMICPLINGAGLRGKVIQYASLKKPIVSTNIGCVGTPFENEKSIYISDSPESFANNAIKLFANKEKSKDLAEQANLVAKNFYGWEKHIDQLEQIINL